MSGLCVLLPRSFGYVRKQNEQRGLFFVSQTNSDEPDTAQISSYEQTNGMQQNELPDRLIHCVDCGEDFVWTSGEQIFFRDKGLQNPPKRCKTCKQAKNDRIATIAAAQASGIKQKVEVAVNCASCGNFTTVPFYPSQGRPVFCRSCFLKMQNPH